MNGIYEPVDSWFYDTSVAVAFAAVWWFAEWFSLLSQKKLQWARDFNIAWSFLSLLLFFAGFFTLIGEHVIRGRHGVSVPTTISTLVSTSLSYVLVAERLSFFDKKARLLQRLVRADKLRFGRPGSLGRKKYIIEWHWWKKGNPAKSWNEVTSLNKKRGSQILLDWGVKHRLGDRSPADVMSCIRGEDDVFWALIGELVYAWLPTGSHAHIHPDRYWSQCGKLRGGYQGSRGRRMGCSPKQVQFDDWLKELSVCHFQLAAMEYPHATEALVIMLPDVAAQANSEESLADLLMTKWSDQIGSPSDQGHR